MVGYFYLNQAEIEIAYCINKDKPELDCHGRCHLRSQLLQLTDENAELPVMKKNKVSFSLDYVVSNRVLFERPDETLSLNHQFEIKLLYQGDYSLSIFIPPAHNLAS